MCQTWVVSGSAVGTLQAGQHGEPREELGDVVLSRAFVLVEPGELRGGERGLDGVHLVVPAKAVRHVVAVAAALDHLAELPAPAHRLGQLGVAGHEQAALAAGRDVLGDLEAERARVADAADRPAAVGRAGRLRGVLDHGEAVPARRSSVSRSMSAGAPCRCTGMIALVLGVIRRSTSCRVEVEGDRVDVGEDRNGHLVHRCEPGGDEAERGHDHLVARSDPERGQREGQRGGAVGHRDAVRRSRTVGPSAPPESDTGFTPSDVGHQSAPSSASMTALRSSSSTSGQSTRRRSFGTAAVPPNAASLLITVLSTWSRVFEPRGYSRAADAPTASTALAYLPRSTVAWCVMSAATARGIAETVRAGDPQPGPRVRDRLDRPSSPGELPDRPIPGRSGAAVHRAARPVPACPSRTGRARAARWRPRPGNGR